jgi:3D-(3,5/4)-trihydroxycyclohexane-1,2-dione acylhydrolase (decyclizing)
VGPIGVIGSSSANEMAGAADVIIAIGTRLQDFTTGSWTVFSHDAQFVSINAARYDATKHRALAVTGDAKETVAELEAALSGWKADAAWTARARRRSRRGTTSSTRTRSPPTIPCPPMRRWWVR